ncbi:hypothetical protein B2G71_14530 [Novosphingobium sp. PC22D]|nr:hypothetical protein B2G71_14530 [Novosphingobium sp. PC22D]
MAATPALAHGYRGPYRHDRIDGGDVLAGLLIIGGIAAIATAASNASKRQADEDEPRYRYPGGPDTDDRDGGYADERPEYPGSEYPRDDRAAARGTPWRDLGGRDEAVDICADEIERGDRRIDSVDTVAREGEGYRVEGRMRDGRDFACGVDGDGRIRKVAIDGRAII